MSTIDTTSDFASAPMAPEPPGDAHPRRRVRPPALDTDRVRPKDPRWYSRFVQMMKVLLPMAALVLVVLIMVWPYLGTEDVRFRISFAALTADETEDPSMVNPRYLGIDKDNQAYSITADLARKLASGAASVELEMPKADITLEDGTWLVLTAKNGVFERSRKVLDLTGAVNLFHDSGYEFRTSKAKIDLELGTASGAVPVRGQGPFGDLRAEGFRLVDKGRTIVFTGKSKLVIYPGAKKAGK